MEYMKGCEDNAFDFCMTSPPYDSLRDYGGHIFGEAEWKTVIRDLYRIIKPGGCVAWNVCDQVVNGSETGTSFKQALYAMDCGFLLQDTLIWFKEAVRFPDPKRYFDAFEYLFIFSKGPLKTFNPIEDRRNKWAGTKNHGTDRNADGSTTKTKNPGTIIPESSKRYNVWHIHNVYTGDTHNHPAPFPKKLAFDCFSTWCPISGKALDPFLGSGTSAIAAHLHGCDFVGTEIDKDYYDAAVDRFNNETKQVDMFSMPQQSAILE